MTDVEQRNTTTILETWSVTIVLASKKLLYNVDYTIEEEAAHRVTVTVSLATVLVSAATVVVTVRTFAFAATEFGADTGTIDTPPPLRELAAFGGAMVSVDTGPDEAVSTVGRKSVGDEVVCDDGAEGFGVEVLMAGVVGACVFVEEELLACEDAEPLTAKEKVVAGFGATEEAGVADVVVEVETLGAIRGNVSPLLSPVEVGVLAAVLLDGEADAGELVCVKATGLVDVALDGEANIGELVCVKATRLVGVALDLCWRVVVTVTMIVVNEVLSG